VVWACRDYLEIAPTAPLLTHPSSDNLKEKESAFPIRQFHPAAHAKGEDQLKSCQNCAGFTVGDVVAQQPTVVYVGTWARVVADRHEAECG
jgi:hypothetical protein